MFVLANGAFKSGSTWLREIAMRMVEFAEIPPAYQHPRFSHWVDPKKLKMFLERADYRGQNYISKGHFYRPQDRTLLLSHDEVYVLDIRRDIKDVLVSHYYHLQRQRKIRTKFSRYYWTLGRFKAHQIKQYHRIWGVDSPQIYVSSFEQLKTNFEEEVRNIGRFLGLDLSDAKLRWLEEQTTIEQLRKQNREEDKPEGERFFRRGAVGDWKDHFDEKALEDLQRIKEEGLRGIGLAKYHLLFAARPLLNSCLRLRAKAMST